MKLEQQLRQRAHDSKWEVWQKMPVTWGAACEERYERLLGFVTIEWVLVGVCETKEDGIRFWNASCLANKATAPAWAGDGFGSSRRVL